MKKGIIIGGIAAGVVAIAGMVIGIAIASNSSNGSKEKEGFELTSSNYKLRECWDDAFADFPLYDTESEDRKAPHKTDERTEDGYPIYEVEWSWEGTEYYNSADDGPHKDPRRTYVCKIGTTEDSYYNISLSVDGKILKTYK